MQPKSCCKRNCKSITARRSAWRHDATATCGSLAGSRCRRRRRRIALIDCGCASHLLHSLCFGSGLFVLLFLGRAILRLPHATHTHTHTQSHILGSIRVSLVQDQCCALVNWQQVLAAAHYKKNERLRQRTWNFCCFLVRHHLSFQLIMLHLGVDLSVYFALTFNALNCIKSCIICTLFACWFCPPLGQNCS